MWPRYGAEASAERGYYYHPSRHSAHRGWMSLPVNRPDQIGLARESWTTPVEALRVRPAEEANEVAADQVKALLGRLGR